MPGESLRPPRSQFSRFSSAILALLSRISGGSLVDAAGADERWAEGRGVEGEGWAEELLAHSRAAHGEAWKQEKFIFVWEQVSITDLSVCWRYV